MRTGFEMNYNELPKRTQDGKLWPTHVVTITHIHMFQCRSIEPSEQPSALKSQDNVSPQPSTVHTNGTANG